MTNYFVTGKGLKMVFNGNVYQKPDAAAIEEGQRLAKVFKNVKVVKVTGLKTETIFRAPTAKVRKQQRIQRNLAICFATH